MKKPPKVLDAIADVVLRYRPKPKSEPAKERKRKKRRIQRRRRKTMTEQSVKDEDQKALDNIPEFGDGEAVTEYDHMKAHYDRMRRNEHEREYGRHGAAMFANGVIEGLRQAIYAIETNRREAQPSNKWPGMNAAIAAIEHAISQRQAEKQPS